MAAFLTAGTSADTSSDFSLAADESATLFLIDASGANGLPVDAQVDIQIKSSAGEYFSIGALTYHEPVQVLEAVGTYRLKRYAVSAAVGVDKN